jgi:murein DD-endopeptidase MepM/ murein hydrolase activator NlpD
LKNEASDLSAEKKELQAKLESLAEDKSTAMERKTLLDQQIANTSAQISNVEEQIQQYAALISQKEEELAQAQEDEAAQYDLFCERVRAMEKRGEVSYWSVLFRADSFTDLLSRLDMINEIMDADQRVIDQLKDLQAEIETAKTELETSKAEEEAAKSELEARKSELNTQRSEANALIQELAANESETEAALDELEAEQEAIREEIQRLNEQLIRPAGRQRQLRGVQSRRLYLAGGQPVHHLHRGRPRLPGGIGSTNHKGTDIGRVGYTSPVYASKAGTVIVAQYSSSYGNYVAISHGTGNTTLYAHMSSLKVSVGQYVNQGDVIGITGSTGNSTGPHLHFEVTENGVRINPLSDGAEPRMGYLTGYTLSSTA